MSRTSESLQGARLEADVCIIGAGPAGIAVARELIGTSLDVIVLESGAYAFDPVAQRDSDAEVTSAYHSVDAAAGGRRRQFGGTANTWVYRTVPDDGRRYARSVPPEAIDFDPPAVEGEAWPLTFEALVPYFERGQRVWNGGEFDYRVDSWADEGAPPLALSEGVAVTKISQHGPRDVFTLRYRDELLAAANVRVLTGTTALSLEADVAQSRVARVQAVNRLGERFAIQARTFVLACGGIENAQLLLASDITSPGAIGNRHDNVGRYLMGHQEFLMGTIESQPPALDSLALYDLRWVGRFMVSGFVALDESLKQTERLLNLSAAMVLHSREFGSPAHRALMSLMHARQAGRRSPLGSTARAVVSSPRDTVHALRSRGRRYQEWSGGWSRPSVDRRRLPVIEVHAATEQTPQRQNRITLSRAVDHLGRQRPAIEWQWSESDRGNTERSAAILAHELEGAGLGRFRRWGSLEGPRRPHFSGMHHPMGSTRMHHEAEQGVVDEACRVHGTENLYVAGSSVFPTSIGYANPTLTILALAVRLGDHLKAGAGAADG